VRTAEWAIVAEPRPASLENTARWKPMIIAPSAPPPTPSALNAPESICSKAQPSASRLVKSSSAAIER